MPQRPSTTSPPRRRLPRSSSALNNTRQLSHLSFPAPRPCVSWVRPGAQNGYQGNPRCDCRQDSSPPARPGLDVASARASAMTQPVWDADVTPMFIGTCPSCTCLLTRGVTHSATPGSPAVRQARPCPSQPVSHPLIDGELMGTRRAPLSPAPGAQPGRRQRPDPSPLRVQVKEHFPSRCSPCRCHCLWAPWGSREGAHRAAAPGPTPRGATAWG